MHDLAFTSDPATWLRWPGQRVDLALQQIALAYEVFKATDVTTGMFGLVCLVAPSLCCFHLLVGFDFDLEGPSRLIEWKGKQ